MSPVSSNPQMPNLGMNASHDAAARIFSFARELQPLCRSISGDGLRQTLRIVAREVPIEIHEVPTGTEVFDWTIPNEWNIRDAYIKDTAGKRVVDFKQCPLHVLNYSAPIKGKFARAELEPHLHSLPSRPDAIPYKTSYYRESWGFCLSQKQRDQLGEGPFEVLIDSSLGPGFLTYGDLLIKGETDEEILFSTHCCHPWMANDNLAGIGVAVELAKSLLKSKPRWSYRFLFIPGTIGSLTWLKRNHPTRIRHGLVLSCVGDPGRFTYKKSRDGSAYIDRVVEHVLSHSGFSFATEPFVPYGYDERQYNSPGFKLPVGCFMRTPNGRYPEYHTSDDNLDLITPDAVAETVDVLSSVIDVLENDARYLNLSPYGEPQLGKRGLYSGSVEDNMPLLWTLNLSDGTASLLEIAEKAGLPFSKVSSAADKLKKAALLEPAKAHGR